MELVSKMAHNCAECDFMRMYDYGVKIYYCDHPDRIDDMGKLGAGKLPKRSPEWCPAGKTKVISGLLPHGSKSDCEVLSTLICGNKSEHRRVSYAVQRFRMERCYIR